MIRDHPRSRGVYKGHQGHGVVRTGSSPLARGLPGCSPPGRSPSRIIPARAGFTILVPAPGRGHTDHPRSRGVYLGFSGLVLPARGSSPLARGLLEGARQGHLTGGIIPARAGFTTGPAGADPSAEDHPRSRGVYETSRIEVTWSYGSSPLARGLPDDRLVGGHLPGIIPARAGFTDNPVG